MKLYAQGHMDNDSSLMIHAPIKINFNGINIVVKNKKRWCRSLGKVFHKAVTLPDLKHLSVVCPTYHTWGLMGGMKGIDIS